MTCVLLPSFIFVNKLLKGVPVVPLRKRPSIMHLINLSNVIQSDLYPVRKEDNPSHLTERKSLVNEGYCLKDTHLLVDKQYATIRLYPVTKVRYVRKVATSAFTRKHILNYPENRILR